MEHQVARTARITRVGVRFARGEQPSVVYELDLPVRAGDTVTIDLAARVARATPATQAVSSEGAN
jgi:copper(I)-binding protein